MEDVTPVPHASEPNQRALEAAFSKHLASILSEPLTLSALAQLFDIDRRTMKAILSVMCGVERCKSFYRVPLGKMPPWYHLERGLIPTQFTSRSAA